MADALACPWVVQRRPAAGLPPLFFVLVPGEGSRWVPPAGIAVAMRFSTAAFGEAVARTVTGEACAAVPIGDPSRWL